MTSNSSTQLNLAQTLANLEALPPDAMLSAQEAAILLGVSTSQMERMRAEGTGPKFLVVGGAIRYKKSDLK